MRRSGLNARLQMNFPSSSGKQLAVGAGAWWRHVGMDGKVLAAIEPTQPWSVPMKIRTSLLALALVALTGTAFAQSSGSMASDAGMSAPAASSAAPAKKHHHKKHHAKKAAASSMASDSGMMSSGASSK
jgi:hypothetical protein